MSSKINVTDIIAGHIRTLKTEEAKYSKADIATFIAIPSTVAIASSILLSYNLTEEVRSLLINFGSIFTALLMSVLVLVYDQESKATGMDLVSKLKKRLLTDLYYNISFSIICSVALVLFSFLHALIGCTRIPIDVGNVHLSLDIGKNILTPAAIFIASTIFINVLMIVKRMHALLTC